MQASAEKISWGSGEVLSPSRLRDDDQALGDAISVVALFAFVTFMEEVEAEMRVGARSRDLDWDFGTGPVF